MAAHALLHLLVLGAGQGVVRQPRVGVRRALPRAIVVLHGGSGGGLPPSGGGGIGGGGDGGSGGGGGGGSDNDDEKRPFQHEHGPLQSTRDWVEQHPMAMKAAAMGVTYSLADIAAQIFTHFDTGEHFSWAERVRRNFGLAIIGLVVVGPLLSIWFDRLEAFCPGTSLRAVLSRTLLDQLLEVPIMVTIIFVLSALAEGHDLTYALKKVRHKLLPTWRGCTTVWAPVQLINQGLIPLRSRVYFMALVSFFWDAYMSIAAHAPIEAKTE
mmetsp:Transcript_26268/g.66668  ORF Transcript_26268/g.66668 Transcript_26268/m.66668 type:complete len:268 (-) Transcript_26268:267-1070(-)